MSRWIRRPLLAASVALGLGGAATPAHAFLDSEKAWNDLLQFAVRQINAPGEFEVELGQVTKPEDGFALISSLKIRDSDGVWLNASGLLVDWNPTSLLRGRFSFETLSADEINVLRAPISRGDPPGEEAQIAFAWPRPPVTMVVETMLIKRMIISGGLLPQDIEARIEGRFVDQSDVQEATLSVQRLDRPGDHIDLGTRIDFDEMDISVSLQATEAPGGLVAELAGLPETEALEVTAAAAGNPSSLPFTVYADIGQIGIADGEGVAQWRDKIGVTFDGIVKPGEKTAGRWRQALGESAKIKLDAEQTDTGAYLLNAFQIDSEAFELTGKGNVDTAANTIDADFDWSAKDIDALNAVIAPSEIGALQGSARAVGALNAPKVDVNAIVRDLKAGFGGVDAIDLRIDSAPNADTASQTQAFSFTAQAEGLALDDPALRDALGANPVFTGNGAFYGAENRVAVESVRIKAASLDLDGNATYDVAAGLLNAELSGAARRIGPFLRAAGVPVDGAADLALKITNLSATSVERLFVNAQLTNLSSEDPNTAALIGEEAVLEALLVEADPGVVKIERGFFESATLRTEAKGQFSVAADTVDLELDWRLKDAARIAPIITPASLGAAEGSAILKGTLSEPKADVAATLSDVAYPGYALAKMQGTSSVQLRKDRRAPFSMDTVVEGFRADDPTLNALVGPTPRFVATGIYDTAISLATLESSQATVAAGLFSLQGDVHIAKSTLDASYVLKSEDLAAIGQAAGVEMSGLIDAEGSVSGPFTSPLISTRADIRDLKLYGYSVDAMDLDLSTAEPSAEGDVPFSLNLAATNPALGDPDLDALIGDAPKVIAKGTFNPEGPRVSLEAFSADLEEIDATASGDVNVLNKTMDLTFDVDAKSLDGLSKVVGAEMAGAITAKGRTSGTFYAPELNVSLDGTDLRYGIYSVGGISGRVDVQQSLTGYAPFDVDIVASDVDLGDPALNDLIGPQAAIQAKGAYNQLEKALRLDSANFDTAAATGTAAGSIDLTNQTVDMTYDVDVSALEPIGEVAGIDLGGSVKAKGKASGSFTAPQIETTLTGRALQYEKYRIAAIDGDITVRQSATGFAPFDIDIAASGIDLGDPALTELVGAKAAIKADGSYSQSEMLVKLDRMTLTSALANATAEGSVDLKDKSLDVDFGLDAASLSPLKAVIGTELAGAIKVDGNVSGPFAEPALATTIDGSGLRYGSYAVGAIKGKVSAQRKLTGFSPFDVDVTASGLDLGDPKLNDVLGNSATIAAKGAFNEASQMLRLESARAVTDAATVSASGDVNLRDQQLDVAFDVDAGDLSPFAAFTGTDLSGAVSAQGTAKGSFTAPAIATTLTARSVRYGSYLVGSVDGRIDIPLSEGGLAPFNVDVTAGGISLGDPALDALIGDSAVLKANGQIDQGAQIIRIASAQVATRGLAAGLQGTVDLGNQNVDMTFNVDANDLSPATALVGTPLGGALKATGSARGSFTAPIVNLDATGTGMYFDRYSIGQLDIDLAMQSDGAGSAPFTLTVGAYAPRLGDPNLDALVGETVTLEARGSIDQTALRIRLDDATARAAAFAARLRGNIDLPARTLDVGYSAHMPYLDRLQPLVGRPLAGDVRVDGRVQGSFDDPATSGVLAGSGVLFDTYELNTVTVRYDLQRLVTGPSGTTSVDAQTPYGPLNANAAFDLTGGTMQINALSVNGLGLNVNGQVRSVPGGVYEGNLALEAADLSLLGQFIGQQITGTATGNVSLNAQNGQQFVATDLNASGVSFAQNGVEIASIGALDLRGTVNDALGPDPFVDGTLFASGAKVQGFPIQQISITARGPLSALDTQISGSGGITGSDKIETTARINVIRFPRGAIVSNFAASYQGIQIASASQFVVEEVAGGGYRATGLDLRIDDGEIVGSGEYTQSGLFANLRMRNIPLQLTQLSGIDLIQSGRLSGQLDIDTRTVPRGMFSLTATSMRLKGAQLDEPFNVTVNGNLDSQALDVVAEMNSALINQPFKAVARIPLSQTPDVPVPLPNMNAPFTASVDWEGDISEVWAFVPAPDHVLSGPVVVHGRATGTLSAPQMTGGVRLNNGRYQNLEFGTLLDAIQATGEFTQDGRVVFDLSATDGVDGTVTGRGSYVVAEGAIDTSVAINRAALVRRDDATVVISGDATVNGPGRGEDIDVRGAFRTEYVEIRLIGGFGSSVVVVDAIPVGETAPRYDPPSTSGKPQRISLDVSLDFPQQVFVRGRGLDSEWGGQIRATGYASDPKVNGLIERRRGWLDLLGRQFELAIGEVRFSGPLDPFIRIRLQRQANDILGWLDIIGPASDIELEFGSIPALSPDEVLPRLLFGRSKQSLSGLEAAQLAAGVATLLSGKANALDEVRGALGVDVLRVEGGDGDGTSISTGKYLTEDVFVGAKQNLETGGTSAVVEIEVFENFEIEGEFGAEEAEASASWKLDY